MANSILNSHYPTSSNTILTSHGWPSGSSGNSVLASHDGDYPASGDTTPDAFSFTDQTDVAVNTTRTSNTITVAGITAAASITITGGEYQIGAGSFTSASGTVTNGQTVTVRHTSSASNSTATNTVLTIGGVSDTFTSTTVAASGFSAVLNTTTGVLTISNGSGYGTKSPAAPFFYQQFTTNNGTADGDLLVGYADQRTYGSNSYGSSITIDTGLGRTAGRGVLKLDIAAGAADFFPHVSLNTSNTGRGTLTSQGTDELYSSYWVKFEFQSGTAASGVQIKSARSGTGASNTDYYTNYPRYVSSLYPAANGTGTNNTFQQVHDSANTASSGEHFDTTNTGWNGNGWNFVEIWQKYNTPGVADGFFRYRINGVEIDNDIEAQSRSAILVRGGGDGALHFDYSMLVPGVDISGNSPSGKYRLLFSEHYVDTTTRRLVLGNASSWSSVTACLSCPATAWSDTGITATAANVPTGYDWAYVIGADGNPINSTGYAYSTTS